MGAAKPSPAALALGLAARPRGKLKWWTKVDEGGRRWTKVDELSVNC